MDLDLIQNNLPQSWALIELKDLVENPKKDIVDGPFGSNLKANEYTHSGIPVFKIQNIKANQFINENINYITREKAKELHRHSFKSGDLIITKLGNPLGLCCKVPDKYSYGIIVADLMRFRPSVDRVFDKYIIHAINSFFIQNQFKAITKGTTRPRVNLTIVRNIKAPYPPLPEQRQIVAKIEELFSELDSGIENLKKAREQLKTYRQAVLKYAFEGKLTEEWRNFNTVYSNNYLKKIKFEIDNFNENKSGQDLPRRLPPIDLKKLKSLPYGWFWIEAHKICQSVRDGTHDTPKYVETGIPLVTSKNLINGKVDFSNIQFISEKDHIEINKRSSVESEDILFGMIGTIGNSVIISSNNNFSIKNVGLFKKNPELILPKYLKYWLDSSTLFNMLDDLQLIRGTTQKFIPLGSLRVLPIPCSSVEEQETIVQEIESRLSVCDKLEQTIDDSLKKSEALRQSILKKAFEGELTKDWRETHPELISGENSAQKLLEKIKAEKALTAGRKKPRSKKAKKK